MKLTFVVLLVLLCISCERHQELSLIYQENFDINGLYENESKSILNFDENDSYRYDYKLSFWIEQFGDSIPLGNMSTNLIFTKVNISNQEKWLPVKADSYGIGNEQNLKMHSYIHVYPGLEQSIIQINYRFSDIGTITEAKSAKDGSWSTYSTSGGANFESIMDLVVDENMNKPRVILNDDLDHYKKANSILQSVFEVNATIQVKEEKSLIKL